MNYADFGSLLHDFCLFSYTRIDLLLYPLLLFETFPYFEKILISKVIDVKLEGRESCLNLYLGDLLSIFEEKFQPEIEI